MLYSPCALNCFERQSCLLLNAEFSELISFIYVERPYSSVSKDCGHFPDVFFLRACKTLELYIFCRKPRSHRSYVNKERVDCEFSLYVSDCATVLFCGSWPYGPWIVTIVNKPVRY